MTVSALRRIVYGIAGVMALAVVAPDMPARAARHSTATPTWLVVHAKARTVTLTLIAGYNNALSGFNYDGYGNGKMVISVPRGYRVNVVFSNKAQFPHSAVFTPFADKDRQDGYPLAFKGSASPDPADGLLAGSVQRFSFVAGKTGTYALVCGVPGHEPIGMWDVLKVTNGGAARLTLSR